ncbi:hypothetical protein HGB07_00215 [Candidatus Roizmanbacteria bacterium]|nr:hypothetical protein [Candidatus Roizmanbacteria bacterium]
MLQLDIIKVFVPFRLMAIDVSSFDLPARMLIWLMTMITTNGLGRLLMYGCVCRMLVNFGEQENPNSPSSPHCSELRIEIMEK